MSVLVKTFESYRITGRQRVHLITHGDFQSRDKDGSHNIRSAIAKNPMLHTKFTAVCFIEPELWTIEVLLCGPEFSTFLAPVTLTLIR